jgi:hypothetical protein
MVFKSSPVIPNLDEVDAIKAFVNSPSVVFVAHPEVLLECDFFNSGSRHAQ